MVHNTHIKIIYEPLKKKNNKIYCHLIAYNFVLLLSILFIHKFRRLRRNNKKRTEKNWYDSFTLLQRLCYSSITITDQSYQKKKITRSYSFYAILGKKP